MRTLVVVLLVAVIGFTFVACGTNDSTPVSGVYYYEAEGESYTLSLSKDLGFMYEANGEYRTGEYFGDGTSLRLVFDKEDEATAKLENGVCKFSYNGKDLTMLSKVNYTVTFNTDGGSTQAQQQVLNGKTATKPADPTRANDIFEGWYVDSAFTAPFDFENQIITQNTTVYAKWNAEDPTQPDFVVNFDANYAGAPAVPAQETFNGKLTSMPQVERAGYEFAGWWVSMLGDGSKLSYQCDTDDVFAKNTTLYAMWIATDGVKQPVVTVTGTNISWTTTASEYTLTVNGPEGFTAISETLSASSKAFNFANQPAGVYEVSVVAKSGQEQSAATVVYYVNKGLAMPEISVAEPATLVYSQVPNAEKYIITIECANHTHGEYDNGKSTVFPFGNCELTEDGITFTVTAVANGYASATATYVYNKVLPQVANVAFDNATETITWSPVAGATNYAITVTVGQQTFTYNNGTSNSFSLKAFEQGEISVAIAPQSKGYNSPEATIYTYNKTTLSAPSNVAVNGNFVTWDEVEGATEYLVKVGSNSPSPATGLSFDITTVAGLQAGAKYQVQVCAVKDGVSSLYSDVATFGYQMLENVSYYANVVTWDAVVGATKYKVQVAGADEFTVEGQNFAEIEFTQAGATTIKVAFYNGSAWSNWVATTVQVYAIEFDARLGAGVETVYVATGDTVNLGSTTRSGYDFAGWYNAPGGATAGAYEYKDGFVYDKATSTVMFAAWTPMKATVSYNFKGYGEVENFGTSTVTFGENYTLKVPTPPSTAYTFGGWYEDIECRKPLTDAYGNSLEAWDHYQPERIVYAKWYQLLSYTKLNDGTYRIKKGPDISKVTEVTIPAEIDGVAVTQIAGFAFDKCYNLQVINIPDTIQYIDLIGKAFNKCEKLQAINVYHVEGNNNIVYKSEDGVLLAYDKNGTQKLELGFVPVTMQGKFIIPDGVEVLPEKIFAKSAITEVTIPASVTEIAENAFQSCANLTKVTFLPAAEGTTAGELSIGLNAFKGCKLLTEITLPARCASFATTETGEISAFSGCISLENVFVEAGNAYFKNPVDKSGVLLDKDGKLLFVPNATEGAYTIPSGVTAIGAYAFAQAGAVTEVTIPAWVTSVEAYAFYNMAKVEKVTFEATQVPFGAVTIGAHAFDGCIMLGQVVYQEGANIAEIGAYAFAGTKALQVMEIPATVTKVGDKAFSGCGARTAVIADGEVAITFGNAVFESCSNLYSITLPARVTTFPEGAFPGCTSLRNVFVDGENTVLKDIDGVLFTKDGKELLFFSPVRGGEYEVPAGVEVIGNNVFQDNTSLSAVTFGADVKTIGDYAFAGCTAITNVHFGANVTYIGAHAFDGCSLKTVTFDQTGTEDLVIGDYAFQKAINNTSTSGTIFTLEIPGRAKSIGDYAFYSAKFVAVKFNEGLQTIGAYAFANNTYLYGNNYDSKTRGGTLAFPASTTTVGDYAFYKCSKLTVLDLDEVENWGKYAFSDCTGITNITFPTAWEVIPEGFMAMTSSSGASKFKSKVTIAKTVKQIEYYAFRYAFPYATGLEFEDGGTEDLILGTYGKKDVRTGEWVVTGYYSSDVFANFGKSASNHTISLPDRLTIIGNRSFYGATKTKEFILGDSTRLMNIGDEAFSGCSALEKFRIPTTVVNLPQVSGCTQQPAIGAKAFYNCKKLTILTFDQDATKTAANAPLSIGTNAFYAAGTTKTNSTYLTTIELPSRMANCYASDGTSITIRGIAQNTTNSSGSPSLSGAFANAKYISSITVAQGEGCVIKAENNIVYSADGKTLMYAVPTTAGEVTIPKSVEYIVPAAFKYTSNGPIASKTAITKVTFEDGGTGELEIGPEAFYGNEGITAAKLPERTTIIGKSSFSGLKALSEVYIPSTVTEIGASAFGGSGLSYNKVEFGRNADGTVNFKKLPNNVFIAWEGITEFEVPEGVESLADGFLGSNTYVEGITKITLANTVNDISSFGFSKFAGLTEVVLKSGNTNYKVENGAIYTADGATLLSVFRGVARTEFEVPTGTEIIGKYAFYLNDTLKSVTVAETVQQIMSGAFQQSYIETVDLKDGDIPLVLDNSFIDTVGLDSITIPARVISMNYAFMNSNVEEINFAPNSRLELMEEFFFMMPMLQEITIPKSVKAIRQVSEFNSCDALTKVTFEEGSQLTEWGVTSGFFDPKGFDDALGQIGYDPTKLDQITLTPVQLVNFPFETVVTYAPGALVNTDVTEVNFAEGMTSIPTGLFTYYRDESCWYRKNYVTKVTIPSTVTTIEPQAFAYTHITEIVLPDGLITIDDSAFEGTNLATVKTPTSDKWPAGLERIGKKAFAGTQITYAYIPNTIVNGPDPGGEARDQKLGIDDSAFENCVNLTTVEVQEGGTAEFTIGKYAFKNTAITSFYFPDRLVDGFATETYGNENDRGAIREGAFEGTKLTEVELPYTMKVTYIGPRAFANCTELTTVTLGYGLETVEEYAFRDCTKLEYVFIPASVKSFDNAFFGCDKAALDLDSDNLDFNMINGVMYNAAETEIIYVAKDATGEIVMPDTVKAVAPGAFKGIQGITAVKFSKALTVIEDSMFEGSGITSVTIPASITSIGARAFANCANLQTVTFEKGSVKGLQIGAYAFYNCTSLQQVEIPERVRNTSSVQGIGAYAFAGCTQLAKVEFEVYQDSQYNDDYTMQPIAIGQSAFQGCTALTSITFPQRLADTTTADVIAIDKFAFDGCTNLATVNFWTNEIGMPDIMATQNVSVGEGAFTNTAITQLVVPYNLSFYGEQTAGGVPQGEYGYYNISYFKGFTYYNRQGVEDYTAKYLMAAPVDADVAIITFSAPTSTPVLESGATKADMDLWGCRAICYFVNNEENAPQTSVTADMLNDFDNINEGTENKKVVVTGSYQGYNFAFYVTVKPHACTSKCDTCQGCTDAECTASVCATKCAGHEVVETPEA